MENSKGKSQSSSSSTNDQVSDIDLTLKLGLSIQDKQKLEEKQDLGQGIGNVEFNNSPSMYGTNEVGSTNFMFLQGYPPQNLGTPSRKRHNIEGKICKSCGVNDTPLWRKGPDGPQTLCNACGLKYLRAAKRGGE
ncbi:hypothetical protein DH2020_020828 [Rehmannia glutinosa]|uniref:GATA-type domain-containing protein n=1 Tax=Rehmannia glutinosa TaxID=99300 RepID=A0ABR0W8L0_REHGL